MKKASQRRNARRRSPRLPLVAVVGFLALAVVGVLIIRPGAGGAAPDIASATTTDNSKSAASLATPPASRGAPLPTSLAARSTPIPALTTASVSPSGQVPTPAPDWAQWYAPLAAPSGGWNLLVLHTNDTWGYVLPCG